jgi:hypothetical protein
MLIVTVMRCERSKTRGDDDEQGTGENEEPKYAVQPSPHLFAPHWLQSRRSIDLICFAQRVLSCIILSSAAL